MTDTLGMRTSGHGRVKYQMMAVRATTSEQGGGLITGSFSRWLIGGESNHRGEIKKSCTAYVHVTEGAQDVALVSRYVLQDGNREVRVPHVNHIHKDSWPKGDLSVKLGGDASCVYMCVRVTRASSVPQWWGVCCVCRLCKEETGSGRSWRHTAAVSLSLLCSRSWRDPGCQRSHRHRHPHNHHHRQTHWRSPQVPVLPSGIPPTGRPPGPGTCSGLWSQCPPLQSHAPHSQAHPPRVRSAGGGAQVQTRPGSIPPPTPPPETRLLYDHGPGHCRGGLSGCWSERWPGWWGRRPVGWRPPGACTPWSSRDIAWRGNRKLVTSGRRSEGLEWPKLKLCYFAVCRFMRKNIPTIQRTKTIKSGPQRVY